MTITYSNGTRVEAIVLARQEDRLRVAIKDSDDLADFTLLNGTWVSEQLEPVQIAFEWQKRASTPTLPESDFICPQELASRLIHLLLAENPVEEEAVAERPRTFAAGGAVA